MEKLKKALDIGEPYAVFESPKATAAKAPATKVVAKKRALTKKPTSSK
jgi:hypothetical protein